jgi:hypothetical protein
MNLYEPKPKQLADSMRVVRKSTIAIAEDTPEAQYDYRPTPDGGGVMMVELFDSPNGLDAGGIRFSSPLKPKKGLSGPPRLSISG